MVGGSITGLGVVLFKFTTPTDEQLIAKMSPEVRAQYERERGLRRKEQEELIRIVKQTSASNDPIWMTGPIKSPLEARGEQMKVREQRERELADQRQQEELINIRKQIEEAQAKAHVENQKAEAASASGKSWFGWGK